MNAFITTLATFLLLSAASATAETNSSATNKPSGFVHSPLPFMTVSAVNEGEPVIREYWDMDGQWITEALTAEGRLRVSTYRIEDDQLQLISTSVKDAMSEPLRFRGDDNPQRQMFDDKAKGVVLVRTGQGMGSGLVIDKRGLVLTNRHVVANSPVVHVLFYAPELEDGHTLPVLAQVIAVSKIADLALLQLQEIPVELQVIDIDETATIDIGDPAYAIGHPFGLEWTITSGTVSQIRNDYDWDHKFAKHHADVIQIQTPINPGNSGGPLFNSDGEVVGINTFQMSPGLASGLNFAVSVKDVREFLDLALAGELNSEDVYDWLDANLEESLALEAAGFLGRAMKCDFDSNGQAELWRYDWDNDGHWDFLKMDIDEDGMLEIYMDDGNRDGIFETMYFDKDLDGQPDYVFFGGGDGEISISAKYLNYE